VCILVNTNRYRKGDTIRAKKPIVNDDSIVIRLSKTQKANFKEALEKNDAVASNVLRRCIDEYINKNK